MLSGDLQFSYRAEPVSGDAPHASPGPWAVEVRRWPALIASRTRLAGGRKCGGSNSAGVTVRRESQETGGAHMTAAAGKGANRAHGARAQHADPLRTADRSRAPGRRRSGGRPGRDDRPTGVEQISVPLIPKVVEALQRLQTLTHLSTTDLVNRAVTLLDFFEAQRSSDRDILIRDNGTQQEFSIRL